MTDFIDILSLLRANNQSLKSVEVYGKITGIIPRPESLSASVKIDDDCVCVNVDMFAVNLARYENILKTHNIYNPDCVYFVRGSMACYVKKTTVMPDWYTLRGNLAIGTKQFSPLLTMFNFSKDSAGKWLISDTQLSDLDFNKWSKNSRYVSYLSQSVNSGQIVLPKEMCNLSKAVSELPKNNIPFSGNIQSGIPQNSLCSQMQSYQNGVVIPQSSSLGKKKKFIIEDRTTPKEISERRDNFASLIEDCENKRVKYIDAIKDKYVLDDNVNYSIRFMLQQLNRYFRSKPNSAANTGRALVKEYLELFSDQFEKKYNGVTAGDYVLQIFDEVVDYCLDDKVVSADKSAFDLIKSAFSEPEIAYAGLLGRIIGVSSRSLMDVAEKCISFGISLSKILNQNPYELVTITNSISIQDIEKIAHCMGLSSVQSLKVTRNIGLLYDYTVYSDKGDTCYKLSDISQQKIGIRVTKAQYSMICNTGSYLNANTKTNLLYYVNSEFSDNLWQYPRTGWVQDGFHQCLRLSQTELSSAVNDFIKSGIGVRFTVNKTDWLTSASLMKKELFVYDKLYELAQIEYDYDAELIDKLIDKFEAMKGFKLEEKQRKAVHLSRFGLAVVTGPAGSGKTTTAECIVFVNKELEGERFKVQYACPTGKAAKRLQEVVGDNVKTMHSLFCIGEQSNDLFTDEEWESADMPDCYIFDENAMVTIDLLYAVLKRVQHPHIWFLGDISQLPPIGKGLPFKNMLRFAPCVRLTVSKRSAEGSGITYNSQCINEYSEPNNWKPLKDCDDFKIVPCADENIASIVALICKYYLGCLSKVEVPVLTKYLGIDSLDQMIKIPNLLPDEIQVVTPVGKATYTWGTYKVNILLQPLFNPENDKSKTFVYKSSTQAVGSTFKVGDRVIHNKNMYAMQWYKTWKDGIFEKAWGNGIMNGDVGTIVGIIPSTECEFYEQSTPKPDSYELPKYNLRNDSNVNSDEDYFVVVEYFDVNSNENYYILYVAKELIAMNDYGNSYKKGIKTFTGSDLSVLQLFYAGTCHKMQGSQNRLIIVLLGKVNYHGFITRNMLYTMVTRASDGVYLLGSVSNDRNSQLSISRLEVADEGVETVGELLYD